MKIAIISDTHKGLSDKTHKIHANFYNKLMQQDFDCILHAGDWIAADQTSLESSLKQIRKYFTCPIFTVRGNHDFWQKGFQKKGNLILPFNKLIEEQNKLFRNHYVSILDGDTTEFMGVTICGMTGWYKERGDTNDGNWITPMINGQEMDRYFQNKAYMEFDKLCNTKKQSKSILLTHFAYTKNAHGAAYKWKDVASDHFNYVVQGHIHHEQQIELANGCLFLNPGSEYDEPKYLILEV